MLGGRGRVCRGGLLLVWVTLLLALLLVLPRLAIAADVGNPEAKEGSGAGGGEEEEEEWEDFEEDDEVSLAAASNKAVGRAVKALPQLNDQNADRILASTEYVLLLGYASWCKQSAKVMIDFAEAATVLAAKGSPAVLAKLDAVANQVTASRYKIKGYPTIVFLTNGTGEFYTAGQTRDDIVTWVQKRTGRPATTFTTKAEAQELQSRDATVVVGLFEKFEGPEYEEFLAASGEAVDVEFFQTTNPEAAKVFGVDPANGAPALAIWKNEPEKFIIFGGQLKREDIGPFVSLNKYALVTKLHTRNAGKVYTSPVTKQVILFANSYDYDSIYPFYLAAARYFKGELFFLWVDIEDEEFAKPMTTMYGIVGSEPTVAGFDNSNGSRYLLEAEVNRQHLKAFIINFKEGRLKMHYKSEPIPKKNKGDVKVVVGKTFEKLVLKSSKDVLLMVYTTYCRDCESLGKVFVRLAKHFKNESSIVFAKVDATANDHPALQVHNYPAFLLYLANSKASPPVEAPPNPSFKKLVQFVEENHPSLLTVATEDIKSKPKASATESKSPLEGEGFQSPTGAVSPEVVKDDDAEARPNLAEAQTQDIGSDPRVTTLEFPEPISTPVHEDTHKLRESVKEDKKSKSEIQPDRTEVEVLQEEDIRSEPTVTSVGVPEVIDTESEGATAGVIEELHLSEDTYVSAESEHDATGGIPSIHTVSATKADEILKAGDEDLQDFQGSEPSTHGHDEL